MENDLYNEGEYSERHEMNTYYEHELGMESFQHLLNIRREILFLRRTTIAFSIAALSLLAILAAVILIPSPRNKSAPSDSASISTAVVDTIEKLKSQNRALKEKNASLDHELKLIRKQFVARTGEMPPAEEVQTGADSEIMPGDSIVFHEVRKGETLYSIAKKYYGDENMFTKIMNDNDLTRISDATEGKQLKIYKHAKSR